MEQHARVTWRELFPVGVPQLPGGDEPPDSLSPATFIVEARDYSCALFDCEAQSYFIHSRTTDELRSHLDLIAQRVLKEQVRKWRGKLSNTRLKVECKEVIHSGLQNRVTHWLAKYEHPSLDSQSHSAKQTSVKEGTQRSSQQPAASRHGRLTGIVDSPVAASRTESHLRKKNILQRDFAIAVGCNERTLRRFRRNGKIRRDLLVSIAREMGLTLEQLTQD